MNAEIKNYLQIMIKKESRLGKLKLNFSKSSEP